MIYIVSDIHGYLGKLKSLLEKINFSEEDTLYILGDIIDRGPEIIDLIRFVMETKNIKMILGNHEDMMLRYYDSYSSYDRRLWYSNGGDVTDSEFKLLSEEEQKEILNFFKSLPLEYNLEINNKKYNLVHGSYVSSKMRSSYTDSEYKQQVIWGRIRKWDIGPDDCVVVFGHTCTRKYKDSTPKYTIWKQDNLIGIDCGMAGYAFWPNQCQLGCLCLNNLTEIYI